MPDPERLTVAERMKEARLRTAIRENGNVTLERMGELVGGLVGRALHPTQWRRYENGESEPPLEVIQATAALAGMSEHYIAFGNQPNPFILKLNQQSAPATPRGAKQGRGIPAPRPEEKKKRA